MEEVTSLLYLLKIKKSCPMLIKDLEDGGFEINPNIVEAVSNIRKQIDIEINNIMTALPAEISTKTSNAMIIIPRMFSDLMKLIAEYEPELAFQAGSVVGESECFISRVESIIKHGN
jgi:hypothetical protein